MLSMTLTYGEPKPAPTGHQALRIANIRQDKTIDLLTRLMLIERVTNPDATLGELSNTDTAAVIRERLAQALPGLRCSCRSRPFVTVSWTQGPTESELLQAIGFQRFTGLILVEGRTVARCMLARSVAGQNFLFWTTPVELLRKP